MNMTDSPLRFPIMPGVWFLASQVAAAGTTLLYRALTRARHSGAESAEAGTEPDRARGAQTQTGRQRSWQSVASAVVRR